MDFCTYDHDVEFKDKLSIMFFSELLLEVPEFARLGRSGIERAIGTALKNSADWNGHRGKRPLQDADAPTEIVLTMNEPSIPDELVGNAPAETRNEVH